MNWHWYYILVYPYSFNNDKHPYTLFALHLDGECRSAKLTFYSIASLYSMAWYGMETKPNLTEKCLYLRAFINFI